jgi:hypothetical protein
VEPFAAAANREFRTSEERAHGAAAAADLRRRGCRGLHGASVTLRHHPATPAGRPLKSTPRHYADAMNARDGKWLKTTGLILRVSKQLVLVPALLRSFESRKINLEVASQPTPKQRRLDPSSLEASGLARSSLASTLRPFDPSNLERSERHILRSRLSFFTFSDQNFTVSPRQDLDTPVILIPE